MLFEDVLIKRWLFCCHLHDWNIFFQQISGVSSCDLPWKNSFPPGWRNTTTDGSPCLAATVGRYVTIWTRPLVGSTHQVEVKGPLKCLGQIPMIFSEVWKPHPNGLGGCGWDFSTISLRRFQKTTIQLTVVGWGPLGLLNQQYERLGWCWGNFTKEKTQLFQWLNYHIYLPERY